MTGSNPQTCPVCGVKILVGIVGGDRVLFSAYPPGTRSRLYARVCRYVDKPGCINKDGGTQTPRQTTTTSPMRLAPKPAPGRAISALINPSLTNVRDFWSFQEEAGI